MSERKEGLAGHRLRSKGVVGWCPDTGLIPGLPAASVIPDPAKGGQPACTGARAVIKVGPNSVWWEFLQFLFFLYNK